jgi:phosphatidate cytidylyltransferase
MIRVTSALVLLAVLMATIWWLPPWVTVLLAACVAALGAGEVAHMAGKAGAVVHAPFVGVTAAFVVLAFVAPRWPGGSGTHDALASVLMTLVVGTGAVALALGPPDRFTLTRVAVMTMAPLYVGLPLGVLAWVQVTLGPVATTWLLVLIAVSDSAQYYCGRAFGRTKLAPSISPAKTVEGAVGGLALVTIAGALTAGHHFPGVSHLVGAALALVLAGFGIVGDLFESLLKRGAGVKDSSALIPGHGGVLDRIDSHLFAAPVFYLFLRYVAP